MREGLNYEKSSKNIQNLQKLPLKDCKNNVNFVIKEVVISKIMNSRMLEIKLDGKSVRRLDQASQKTGLSPEEIVRIGFFKILDSFESTGRIEVESKSNRSKAAFV